MAQPGIRAGVFRRRRTQPQDRRAVPRHDPRPGCQRQHLQQSGRREQRPGHRQACRVCARQAGRRTRRQVRVQGLVRCPVRRDQAASRRAQLGEIARRQRLFSALACRRGAAFRRCRPQRVRSGALGRSARPRRARARRRTPSRDRWRRARRGAWPGGAFDAALQALLQTPPLPYQAEGVVLAAHGRRAARRAQDPYAQDTFCQITNQHTLARDHDAIGQWARRTPDRGRSAAHQGVGGAGRRCLAANRRAAWNRAPRNANAEPARPAERDRATDRPLPSRADVAQAPRPSNPWRGPPRVIGCHDHDRGGHTLAPIMPRQRKAEVRRNCTNASTRCCRAASSRVAWSSRHHRRG